VNSGAASTARAVTPTRPTSAIVISRWVYSAPPSGSALARDSSGMATEVSTPPITSSKTMFGRVFARLYESLAMDAPSTPSSSALATNPVILLARVATAIIAPARTTPLVRAVRSCSSGAAANSAPIPVSAAGGWPAGNSVTAGVSVATRVGTGRPSGVRPPPGRSQVRRGASGRSASRMVSSTADDVKLPGGTASSVIRWISRVASSCPGKNGTAGMFGTYEPGRPARYGPGGGAVGGLVRMVCSDSSGWACRPVRWGRRSQGPGATGLTGTPLQCGRPARPGRRRCRGPVRPDR